MKEKSDESVMKCKKTEVGEVLNSAINAVGDRKAKITVQVELLD